MTQILICIDDKMNEYYGSLNLQFRKVKDPRLTYGKEYQILFAQKNTLMPNKFTSFLIQGDTGEKHWIDANKFEIGYAELEMKA